MLETVHRVGLDAQGVVRERVLLDAGDIGARARGQRQDERDADDADASGEGGEQRARLFGEQVVQTQVERCPEVHLGLLFARGARGGGSLLARKGVGVGYDLPIQQPHDAGGIALRKLRVVRDHDDKAVPGNLF